MHFSSRITGHSASTSADYWFSEAESYFSLIRLKCDKEKCVSCGKCKRVCPMNVDVTDNSRKRKNGTECIL
ncbi:MAG: 4Fe-4S binding protein [Faecalibacterium prausnitzii]